AGERGGVPRLRGPDPGSAARLARAIPNRVDRRLNADLWPRGYNPLLGGRAMVVLGIESTAHTASVGIVGDDAKVLGLASDFYRPPAGGIHPREAANHHVDVLPSLVGRALEAAHVRP